MISSSSFSTSLSLIERAYRNNEPVSLMGVPDFFFFLGSMSIGTHI